ncbi:MAG: hypothetical protein A2Y62_02245 [Candidatus Fischerbacteria bacterium RBG_13_37_8]|uniref:Nucleotidyltransferase-like domain-containing protein n=1 Tax=Candidatus Fischerbacteria bacterium RBG_13_37_8 TaxID=1817863 RepID=A0A1F5VVJ3_9BACT|nr:MAG: hypothetical protein A2Y62_02245 [Candidatus Fischerbacteria bacterium RBG_13_37_8]
MQKVTAEEIIKLFAQNSISFLLIGSYYLPVIKEVFKFNLPSIKTQDIDFLLRFPYHGKPVDIEYLLKPIGFTIGFYDDGSTYFTNGIFSIEFLVPEKGKSIENALSIKPLKIKAIPLRYMEMLFNQPIKIDRGDYSFFVPSPWIFAFHKILISAKRRNANKREKDILQAKAILREIFNKEKTKQQALSYLKTLPPKWRTAIKIFLAKHFPLISN